MITTKQVRAIIRKHIPDIGSWRDPIWTNKWRDDNVRNIKIYDRRGSEALLKELRAAAGAKNVRVVYGYSMFSDGITVRCVLG